MLQHSLIYIVGKISHLGILQSQSFYLDAFPDPFFRQPACS